VIVPKVNLVLHLICQSTLDRSSVLIFEVGDECRTPEIQSRVSIFKLAMSAISGSLAAIVAPKLGALSDRYGRTPMIVWINTGMILNEMITILCARFPDVVSVNWILVGAVFDGLGGSFIASMAVSHS
jgi:MFS family permease